MDDSDAARLADVAALEPLPEEKHARLAQLRTIADGGTIPMAECPECGVELDSVDAAAHADYHWPPNTRPENMSKEAFRRRATVLRFASKQRLPDPPAADQDGQ